MAAIRKAHSLMTETTHALTSRRGPSCSLLGCADRRNWRWDREIDDRSRVPQGTVNRRHAIYNRMIIAPEASTGAYRARYLPANWCRKHTIVKTKSWL